MALAPIEKMTLGEIIEYVEKLESENKSLRAKTDNSKKLDERDASRIRELYNTQAWTYRELGQAFAVNPATICRIVNNEYYAVN